MRQSWAVEWLAKLRQFQPTLPRIVVFADLVDSTKAAKESAVHALLRTLTHHLVSFAHPERVLRGKGLSVSVINTVGDEIIVSVCPPENLDKAAAVALLRSYLDGLLRGVCIAVLDLSKSSIETKVGLHWCEAYVPAEGVTQHLGIIPQMQNLAPGFFLDIRTLFPNV